MYNVAIVDDNQDFCFVLECLLKNYFQVSGFLDISKFLQSLESQTYDVILVDFTLLSEENQSIKNGCELIVNLKNKLSNPPLCILLTGWIGKNDLEGGKKLCPQADGFLPKDADIPYILEQINTLLASR